MDRDLFENGHTIFIRSKLDFIWIFEIFAVLKASNPVHATTGEQTSGDDKVFFIHIIRIPLTEPESESQNV